MSLKLSESSLNKTTNISLRSEFIPPPKVIAVAKEIIACSSCKSSTPNNVCANCRPLDLLPNEPHLSDLQLGYSVLMITVLIVLALCAMFYFLNKHNN